MGYYVILREKYIEKKIKLISKDICLNFRGGNSLHMKKFTAL